MRSSPPRSLKGNKDVNDLLHTLRGEHFRRVLNSQRTPGTAPLPTSPALGPSLPYAEIYGLQHHHFSSQAVRIDVKVSPTPVAGPIPRSWAVTTSPAKAFESPEWRETALSLFFAQTGGSSGPMADVRPAVPRLGEFCLRVILRCCGTDADVLSDFVPYLGPHLRKQLMRICALRCPLPSASLRVLLGEEHNQVDGELVVVGPTSPPCPELFQSKQSQVQKDLEGLWDADDPSPQPLTALAIMSATLSTPALLAFPPSVTHLALIHLSAPVPLHRLPDKCPLLEVLDISYNPWLGEPAWGGERALEKVAWHRWAYLKILGCRECGIALGELRNVNEGRWDDVTIVT
ncbi:hypothetical protein EDB87DRAFT_169427 [Lactarius vividus]|nr:hypothetical protein EDB87DRAFT_169427 [Lactarius vividus]